MIEKHVYFQKLGNKYDSQLSEDYSLCIIFPVLYYILPVRKRYFGKGCVFAGEMGVCGSLECTVYGVVLPWFQWIGVQYFRWDGKV